MRDLVAMLALITLQAQASDLIDLKQRVTTFTNLQGEAFSGVSLVHGDLDGVVWRKDASGGRVCYTNLALPLLEAWGIPTNRFEVARTRAAAKATAFAQRRAAMAVGAAAEAQERAKQEAQWRAGQPAREKGAERERDAQEIATLETQITDAEAKMRRARAIAYDYNRANVYNDYAPTVYIKETEQVKIDEARDRLTALKRKFREKYPEP
jgi:hypothetical protein